MILRNEESLSHTTWLCSSDCMTEITAQNLFTGHEIPLVISHKEAFDGYLDTVIGELLGSNHFYAVDIKIPNLLIQSADEVKSGTYCIVPHR